MRIERVDHFHTVDSNPDFFIKFVDEGNRLETGLNVQEDNVFASKYSARPISIRCRLWDW